MTDTVFQIPPASMAAVVTRQALRLVIDPDRAALAGPLARRRAWARLMQARAARRDTVKGGAA